MHATSRRRYQVVLRDRWSPDRTRSILAASGAREFPVFVSSSAEMISTHTRSRLALSVAALSLLCAATLHAQSKRAPSAAPAAKAVEALRAALPDSTRAVSTF